MSKKLFPADKDNFTNLKNKHITKRIRNKSTTKMINDHGFTEKSRKMVCNLFKLYFLII